MALRPLQGIRILKTSLKLISSKMSTSTEVLAQNDLKDAETPDYLRWRKAKKVAVMCSFVGKDYLGMQRNPGFPTIEEDLMKAFRDAETISQDWYDNPQKAFFQRASRTDKGVSAARMVISLKMVLDEKREETIDRINSKLPACIKVHAIKKVTKNFNCKSQADARTYLYLLPTFAFAPIVPDDENAESQENSDFKATFDFRMNEALREKVNSVLQEFVGTKYYHNYTSGKVPLEPSCQRYITDFHCAEPFEKDGMEFVILKIKGQSFMLHQIRKMIGMSIAIIRGQTPLQTISKTWDTLRIDIPRAPGLGLMLDEIHFDRYNHRFSNDGMHEGLEWTDVNDQVEAFKQDYIFSEMINTEKDEKSMFEWLKNLPIHSFEQRHFENTKHVDSILMSVVGRGKKGDKEVDDDE